ncbi:polysaccharide biosynthesis/export family protein [Flavobacterium sp.]|jgi:polysaccharide export outer membrane protein|uniref:polysaccharide biosynthesis/export family protein n=1 Tax=Flavobacterium sp. TaxID=239 RepID=UPI0037BE61FF
MKVTKQLFLGILLIIFVGSCASPEKLVYMQNIEAQAGQSSGSFEPLIQPDDMLQIIVSAVDPETVIPFNLPTLGPAANLISQQTYIVDYQGTILFPVLGSLKIGGLTRSQAVSMLVDKLSNYVKDPQINFRILNFKVAVQGEVNKPGVFTISSERITLLEAIAQAGDLTIYGKRDNILVIREQNGTKTYARVDLTKADFFQSPYYYLTQNDVVYVEPNKTKINASAVGPNITVIFTGISLLITIVALTIR